MNYKLHYDKLINNRRNNPITEGYMENHHILPRSLGGSDKSKNLIRLTAKEHFITHLLLTRMYKKKSVEYYKMIKSFGLMCWYKSENQERYITSNEYSWLRKEFSKAQSKLQQGEKNSNYGNQWIYSDRLRLSKLVPKSEEIPEGWKIGRVLDFDERDFKIEEKESIKINKKREKEELCIVDKEKANEWYPLYKKYGFEKFVELIDYRPTHMTLLKLFSKYVKEYNIDKKRNHEGKHRKAPSLSLLRRIKAKLDSKGAILDSINVDDSRISATSLNRGTPYRVNYQCGKCKTSLSKSWDSMKVRKYLCLNCKY